MAGSVFDSPLFSKLFPCGDAGRLFTDAAEIRALMLVEGTLAKVQGELGVIPVDSAFFIHRASMECQIDPSGLAVETGQNGVCIPGLVAAFRKAMEAPEHAQFIHYGATSQDIIDTGLMLRLRQLLSICSTDLKAILLHFARLAETHADTPMAARTWGQQATVTSFGAQVAEWGQPLADLFEELTTLRDATLMVSLSGAAGTSSALPLPFETRAALAKALNLRDPGRSWHTDRNPVLRIADWLTRLNTALGKFGADLGLMSQTGIEEITLGSAGSSSTMPQKQNPVAPASLIALSHQAAGLRSTLQAGAQQKQQRDGAAWFTEWLTLPQLCLGAASALVTAKSISASLAPQMATMRHGISETCFAETIAFSLAQQMPLPDAKAAVKSICTEATTSGTALSVLTQRHFPTLDIGPLFDPQNQMGTAPQSARNFASHVSIILS